MPTGTDLYLTHALALGKGRRVLTATDIFRYEMELRHLMFSFNGVKFNPADATFPLASRQSREISD